MLSLLQGADIAFSGRNPFIRQKSRAVLFECYLIEDILFSIAPDRSKAETYEQYANRFVSLLFDITKQSDRTYVRFISFPNGSLREKHLAVRTSSIAEKLFFEKGDVWNVDILHTLKNELDTFEGNDISAKEVEEKNLNPARNLSLHDIEVRNSDYSSAGNDDARRILKSFLSDAPVLRVEAFDTLSMKKLHAGLLHKYLV